MMRRVVQAESVALHNSRPFISFFLDFDSTCTVRDTCTVIPTLSRNVDHSKWQQVSQRYGVLYTQTLEQQLSIIDVNNDEEKDTSALQRFISPFAKIEYIGVNETQQNQCMANIHRDQLIQMGKQKGELRSDLKPFMNQLLAILRPMDDNTSEKEEVEHVSSSFGTSLSIMSANWSFTVVQSSFEQLGLTDKLKFVLTHMDQHELLETESEDNKDKYIIPVYCNELEFDDKSVTTGRIKLQQIVSSEEKKQCMVHRILQQRQQMGPMYANQIVSVFVGDALHDILCLTNADIGIIITSAETNQISSSLRNACNKLNIQLLEISKCHEMIQDILNKDVSEDTHNDNCSANVIIGRQWTPDRESKTLFIAHSWTEIASALFPQRIDSTDSGQ